MTDLAQGHHDQRYSVSVFMDDRQSISFYSMGWGMTVGGDLNIPQRL
jgi:hypothetical protein